MSYRRKCGCKFSSQSDADVRHGISLSGELLSRCAEHQRERDEALRNYYAQLPNELRGWHRISTVPKDGTPVLLASTKDAAFGVRQSRWNTVTDGLEGLYACLATHWMKFPELPQKEEV